MIFVRLDVPARLGESVFFAEAVTKSVFVDLSAYPPWLVVLVGTLVIALAVWVLIKVLKWALWLLFLAVLIGGACWAGWLLFNG